MGDSLEIGREFEQKLGEPVAVVCAKLEAEMIEMSAGDREILLGDYGDGVPTLDDLI